MGAKKTTDFLEKATWTLAVAVVVLSLLATATIPRKGRTEHSMIEQQINKAIDPNAIPTLPTATPLQPGTSDKQNNNSQENK